MVNIEQIRDGRSPIVARGGTVSLTQMEGFDVLILLIVLLLVFGGGGGYYGHSRWGAGGGTGIGLGTVLVIVLLVYLLGGLR
jgi:hypothetical protein